MTKSVVMDESPGLDIFVCDPSKMEKKGFPSLLISFSAMNVVEFDSRKRRRCEEPTATPTHAKRSRKLVVVIDDSVSLLDALPAEVVTLVLRMLPVRDVMAFRATSKLSNDLVLCDLRTVLRVMQPMTSIPKGIFYGALRANPTTSITHCVRSWLKETDHGFLLVPEDLERELALIEQAKNREVDYGFSREKPPRMTPLYPINVGISGTSRRSELCATKKYFIAMRMAIAHGHELAFRCFLDELVYMRLSHDGMFCYASQMIIVDIIEHDCHWAMSVVLSAVDRWNQYIQSQKNRSSKMWPLGIELNRLPISRARSRSRVMVAMLERFRQCLNCVNVPSLSASHLWAVVDDMLSALKVNNRLSDVQDVLKTCGVDTYPTRKLVTDIYTRCTINDHGIMNTIGDLKPNVPFRTYPRPDHFSDKLSGATLLATHPPTQPDSSGRNLLLRTYARLRFQYFIYRADIMDAVLARTPSVAKLWKTIARRNQTNSSERTTGTPAECLLALLRSANDRTLETLRDPISNQSDSNPLSVVKNTRMTMEQAHEIVELLDIPHEAPMSFNFGNNVNLYKVLIKRGAPYDPDNPPPHMPLRTKRELRGWDFSRTPP